METQLRFVDLGDRQVTFTFGASSASDVFGVPPFSVTPVAGRDGSRFLFLVHFDRAGTMNPDGSASYNGPIAIAPADAGMVSGAVLARAEGRGHDWQVGVSTSTCPHIASKTYSYGKSPRAQVSITFATTTSVTFEHSSISALGSPVGSPVLLSGMGFAPSDSVQVRIGTDVVWESRSNASGDVDTGFVPPRPPGRYEIIVTDGHGHEASGRLLITDER